MLISTGKLDPGFADGNYFGQTHRALVRRISATQLQAAVATCGPSGIPDHTLFRLAPQAGRFAGLIASTDAANIRGAVGGWDTAVSAFGGGTASCPLGAGALVQVVYFDQGAVLPPYMSRLPMPEFGTEASTMRTTMLMGGNTIEGVQDVQLTDGRWLSTALSETDLVRDGTSLPKPSCPHGTPAIFLGASVFSGNGTGLPLVGVQPSAQDNGATWTINVPIWTVNDWGTGTVSAGAGPHGLALVIRKCQ